VRDFVVAVGIGLMVGALYVALINSPAARTWEWIRGWRLPHWVCHRWSVWGEPKSVGVLGQRYQDRKCEVCLMVERRFL